MEEFFLMKSLRPYMKLYITHMTWPQFCSVYANEQKNEALVQQPNNVSIAK
jgi:hypothetical protein